MKLRFSLLVYNLFDRLNEYGVNATTGRANQQIIREGDLNSHRSDFNEYEDRVNNPANFGSPREVKLEVGFLF